MTSGRIYRKVIKQVLSIEQAEGVGARVRRSIGTGQLRNLDPFLMLDEFKVRYPAGFPDHPHRGFETVTYMLEGSNQHEDFAGNSGIIGPGDLQWMTAGKGIVHAEMPLSTDPNVVATGLQLWINLASKDKMCEPNYQDLKDAEIPRATPTPGITIKVIAGESYGVKSPVRTTTPAMYLDFMMGPNETAEQTIPADFETAFAYTLTGLVEFGAPGTKVEAHTTAVFDQGEANTPTYLKIKTGDQPAHFVIIAGKPLKEPIVQYGPFVMNDGSQIQKTFMDYQFHMNGFERAEGWRSKIGRRMSI